MRSNPTISIVIPTRNRRQLLQETMASIMAQTFRDWELIVIDDASEDDTFSCMSRMDDERIKAIRLQQHSERSAARNLGLGVARGEFIQFFDDDDLLVESALQLHLEAFKRYPAAIASVGSVTRFDRHGTCVTVKNVQRRCLRRVWIDLIAGWNVACGPSLFRTEAIKAVKGWDTTYSMLEDIELWLRLARRGPVALMPEVIYKFRIHDGQWRPPQRKLWKLATRLLTQSVQQTAGSEREAAERFLAARECFHVAAGHYQDDETLKALASYWKGVRLAPGVLRSPLMGPRLRLAMRNCLIGGRPVIAFWQQRLLKRKNLDFSGRSIIPSEGRVSLAVSNEDNI